MDAVAKCVCEKEKVCLKERERQERQRHAYFNSAL